MSSGSRQTSGQFSKWQLGDNYTLVRNLGRGSYGEVAEAIANQRNGAKCAVKQMERIFDEKTDAKRAYREIHILRQLSHTNIIGLLDVVFTEVRTAAEGAALLQAEEMARAAAHDSSPSKDGGDGKHGDGDDSQSRDEHAAEDASIWGGAFSRQPSSRAYRSPLDKMRLGNLYLVFEYMDTDLQKIMRSSQFMSSDHVKFILYQILVGLKYLHSANVIHRDLKPANILISCADCSIKIADFGLSRVVRPDIANGPGDERPSIDESSPGMAGAGMTDDATEMVIDPSLRPPTLRHSLTRHVITRWYRAPEVICSLPYDGAVDVWSGGCIFGELLGMEQANCRDPSKREPLFPGESCGDLSGEGRKGAGGGLHRRKGKEQLDLILQVIGIPPIEHLAHLDADTREYILTYRAKKDAIDLPAIYPAASGDAIQLLKQMLLFFPGDRISVDAALACPYLQTVRSPACETTSIHPMHSDIETEGEKGRNLLSNVIREVMYYRNSGV